MSDQNKKSVLLIMTGFKCNNNCIMCSVQPKKQKLEDKKTDEMLQILKQGRKDGFDKVEFTGGEPTIRRDIFYLVRNAAALGYEQIGVGTNGRLLSYDWFCEKLIAAGVNSLTFTLYSDQQNVHERITATQDSYTQTVTGIKNALAFEEVDVSVNTVVMKQNFDTLFDTGKLLSKLGVTSWSLLDLLPDGYSARRYKFLSVSLSEFEEQLLKMGDVFGDFNDVSFFDFSMCVFPEDFVDNDRYRFYTGKKKQQSISPQGYKEERFGVEQRKDGKYYTDLHKKRIKVCERCKHKKGCPGVWSAYLDLFGKKEVEKLASQNNCLVG